MTRFDGFVPLTGEARGRVLAPLRSVAGLRRVVKKIRIARPSVVRDFEHLD